MKISELLAALSAFREEHGDLDVEYFYRTEEVVPVRGLRLELRRRGGGPCIVTEIG